MEKTDVLGLIAQFWNTIIYPFWQVIEPFATLGSGIKTLVGLLP